MKAARRTPYILLAVYIAASMTFYFSNVVGLIYGIWIPHNRAPLVLDFEDFTLSELEPEAIAAGLKEGDVLEMINGERYSGQSQWNRAIRSVDPGADLILGVRHADGGRATATVPLTQDTEAPNSAQLLLMAMLGFSAPLVCLVIGYWVVAARPHDPNAWLVLGLLTIPETLVRFNADVWWGPPFFFLQAWYWFVQIFAPSILLWFGLYFPQRSRIDVRAPWLKWIFVVIQSTVYISIMLSRYAQGFAPDLLSWTERLDVLSGTGWMQFVCLALFSVVVFHNYRTAPNADAKRRMRVMATAWLVAFLSLLALVLLLPRLSAADDFSNLGIILILVTLLLTFPLSVAYVVVVQRAMDVRLLLRMGTKYALARGTITVVRAAIVIAIAVFAVRAIGNAQVGIASMVQLGALGGVLFVVSTRTQRLSNSIDRKFFREAYNAEIVLSDLSDQVRTFRDTGPLVETVTRGIAGVLHVPQVSVLLTVDGATHPCLATKSATLQQLHKTDRPVSVYRDNPQSWFHGAAETEQQALLEMNAELVLALKGRDRLMGIIVLGPKLSEEPYTPMDLRMLQSVATQTGLALEVTELAHSLAKEEAQRQRIQREIEIAREVQERLFPQEMPSVTGITLAGSCRPALGVGGDYYDVISLGDGLIGLAIGDVSGKGISAALLMASLRASLRGMTMYGSGNLAEMMQRVNQLVYEASSSNRYATFFFAVYNPATRELRFVNAGHNPPMIVRDEVMTLQAGGPVVGLLPGIAYSEETITLRPGDLFFAYTDGISEAMNIHDEEWGETRMLAAFIPVRDKSAQDILHTIFNAADAFTGGAMQHDDMTVLMMKLEEPR